MTFAEEPAPLLELSLAFSMLQRRDAHPVFGPWRRRTARGMPRQARALLELVSPLGAGPFFLDPPSPAFDEGLERVLSTPRAAARAELDRMCGIDRSLSPWMRNLAAGERDAWQTLDQAIRSAHTSVLAENWPDIRAGFQTEIAWRARVLAQQGLHATLSGLCPSLRWRGLTLEARSPRDQEFTLHGQGIILQPSLLWADHLLAAAYPDGRFVLIYPALTPLPLRGPGASDDPLTPLVGATRARALRLLVRQHTTTDLARELSVTPAAASMQAKTLRQAGLIVSQRDGKAVWHWCTPLGLGLLAANGGPTEAHGHRSAARGRIGAQPLPVRGGAAP
ncbi:ArsR/SmtB family transcription factor [Streptomyces sp. YGL11-2]|uniref:ArsR/SmtB family transcription factor n=1 Tax=Streptomyces sp. YGL11-2 TaxID=3414028 RepID=UPI003CEC13B3